MPFWYWLAFCPERNGSGYHDIFLFKSWSSKNIQQWMIKLRNCPRPGSLCFKMWPASNISIFDAWIFFALSEAQQNTKQVQFIYKMEDLKNLRKQWLRNSKHELHYYIIYVCLVPIASQLTLTSLIKSQVTFLWFKINTIKKLTHTLYEPKTALFLFSFCVPWIFWPELGQCNEGSVSQDDGSGRQKTIISFLFDSAHLG